MNIVHILLSWKKWPPIAEIRKSAIYRFISAVIKLPFKLWDRLVAVLARFASKRYASLENSRFLKVHEGRSAAASQRHMLCIFAHYDSDGLVDKYVLHYLEKLNSIGCDIVFVSTAKLDRSEVEKLEDLCLKILVRPNIGYDFGSYKTGVNFVGKKIGDYQRIILANDSVYGPLYPLSQLAEEMSSTHFDVWGVTESWEYGFHLQSYFIMFSANVVRSSVFSAFFDQVNYFNFSKRAVILDYEVGFTRKLMKAGFSVGSMVPYTNIRNTVLNQYPEYEYNAAIEMNYVNPTHFFWFSLIEDYRFPFLKVELLRDNPLNLRGVSRNWLSVISDTGHYDPDLIIEHLKRHGASQGSV